MTGRERAALAGAAALAIAMPLWLLRSSPAAPVAPPPASAPLTAAPSPPLRAVYGRDLFAGGAPVEEGEAPSDAPALAGIVGRIGVDAVALVRVGDSSRTLAPGESADGWTLESLAIDAAYFTRGGQRVRVSLPAG